MIICPKCQYQNPDNVYYCVNCGEKLVPPIEQISFYCPFCYAPLPPGVGFCTWCGRELYLAKPAEYVPEQVPPAQPLPPIQYLPPYEPPKRYGKIIGVTVIFIVLILISGVVMAGFIKGALYGGGWQNPFSPSGGETPWAKQDPDNDGLTNEQEQQLGSNISSPDLFLEIDYMPGWGPSNAALNYLSEYYLSLGITVHITTTPVTESQLQAIGVSPASLDANECSLIEQHFHNYSTTHVYVFYAKAIDGELFGWSNYFGAFIDREAVNDKGDTLVGTNRERIEKVVLLHEVGHCVNILELDSSIDEDGDGTIENYCNDIWCIMAKGETFLWTNIAEGVITLDEPTYCARHWALHNLKNKWSVDEPT